MHPNRAARTLCVALAAFAWSCARPPDTLEQQHDVRVMTYNIFAGQDLTRASNLSRVAALIDSLGVDFVLLQEVDRNTARSGDVDQPAVLARLTGLHAIFGRAMDHDGGEYGVAILSRWPVRTWRVVPLDIPRSAESVSRRYEPRTLLHLIAEMRAGSIHVLTTHLDHQADPRFRQLQLVQLMAYVAEAVPRNDVAVLGGDLNARAETAEVRALGIAFDDVWVRCGTGPGPTFRSDAPDRRIDYILVRNAPCRLARVLDRIWSDHRPVLADLAPHFPIGTSSH